MAASDTPPAVAAAATALNRRCPRSRRHADRARGRRDLGTQFRQVPGDDTRRDDQRQRHGQGSKPGEERCEAKHDLDVEVDEVNATNQDRPGQERSQERCSAVALRGHAQRQERMPDCGLDQDKECHENDAGGNESPGFGGIPAVFGIGEAVHKGRHCPPNPS
jgi:hypothetical protein